jgi:DNA primase large subunit
MWAGDYEQGLGLSLPEALVFWRRAFQKTIPEDKFAKSYAYNIRYNYGQEGKRTDFAPHRCVSVHCWSSRGYV